MRAETITATQFKAVKCDQNCICQAKGGAPCCKITGTVNNTIFFTESRHPDGCSRQHTFGSTFICTCPVRQDIYMKTNT